MKNLEEQILQVVINQSFHWDEKLIEVICNELDLTEEKFTIIFPRGIENLADYFFEMVDNDMLSIVNEEFHKLPIHLQVAKFLLSRFKFLNEKKDVALKVLNMKCCLTYQLSHVAKTADLIWNNINHKSSGFDYYTRRIILAGIYSNCLLHFKKDLSAEDMEKYIKNQLKIVGKITQIKKKIYKN